MTRSSEADSGQKLEVLRVASRHSFPTGDTDQLLVDIERGYLGEGPQ
jgi:hypothetical protein